MPAFYHYVRNGNLSRYFYWRLVLKHEGLRESELYEEFRRNWLKNHVGKSPENWEDTDFSFQIPKLESATIHKARRMKSENKVRVTNARVRVNPARGLPSRRSYTKQELKLLQDLEDEKASALRDRLFAEGVISD